MITIDLRKKQVSLKEILRQARIESLHIVADDGQEYILEATGDFEQEVMQLGHSEKFKQFLAQRRSNTQRISLEEVEQRLKPLSDK